MRILVDLQALQSSLNAGKSGSSDIAFVTNLLKHKSNNEVYLILSSQFPHTLEVLRREFEGLVSQDNIKIWYAPGPISSVNALNGTRRKIAQVIYSAFIKSFNPDVLHFLSLTEASEENVVWEGLQNNVNVVVTLGLSSCGLQKLSQMSASFDEEPSASTGEFSKFLNDVNAFIPDVFCKQGYLHPEVLNQELFDPEKGIKIISPSVGFCQVEARQWSTWSEYVCGLFSFWEGILKSEEVGPSDWMEEKASLAFVSPLPPERTGIADYSADLLEALAEHYDITVIVDQAETELPARCSHIEVRGADWLVDNVRLFDRIVYQVGNSHYHDYMLPLLDLIPGVVVLHDYFLYDLFAWRHYIKNEPECLQKQLYFSHGYGAVYDYYAAPEAGRWKYPVNFSVLYSAKGVITHSKYSKTLAREWYNDSISKEWRRISLVRNLQGVQRDAALRESMGVDENAFVVCSFGHLGESKLNLRLLDAWAESELAKSEKSLLIFVGQLHSDPYGLEIQDRIKKCKYRDRIIITGYVDKEEYLSYLSIADAAVQLRCKSRGESSAAVLDCMGAGLPLIVNANGSMAELDERSVMLLPDEFSDHELIFALEKIWKDPDLASEIGSRAQKFINENHNPKACAEEYYKVIEKCFSVDEYPLTSVLDNISEIIKTLDDQEVNKQIAVSLDRTFTEKRAVRTLYLDVSITADNDYKTGIQRVVRAITREMIKNCPGQWRIEPVKITDAGGCWNYITVPEFSLGLFEVPASGIASQIVKPVAGDIVLVLDLTGRYLTVAEEAGLYHRFRAGGVKVFSIVYDVLPVTMPHVFPSYAENEFKCWLKSVASLDGAICISDTVANDLRSVLDNMELVPEAERDKFAIHNFHLGADVENSSPTRGLPDNAKPFLKKLAKKPTFLMVGTVEPRKGHLEVLNAFNKLWADRHDVNLVIVGKEGWLGLDEAMRSSVSATVEAIRNHKQLNSKLFWLDSASDEYLELLYESSNCLLAASLGEGFGLPLIEAAQHKIPIIARDIPVFREVAGEHAFYFDSKAPEDLAMAIQEWLELYMQGKHPRSDNMPWLTWGQSAENLLSVIFNKKLIK